MIQVTEDEIFVDKNPCRESISFHEQFQMPQYCSVWIPRMKQRRDGALFLTLMFLYWKCLPMTDLIPVSMVAYPGAPYDQVLLEGSGNVEIYEIRE